MVGAVHLGDLGVGALGLALDFARGFALSRAAAGLAVTSVALGVDDIHDGEDVGENEQGPSIKLVMNRSFFVLQELTTQRQPQRWSPGDRGSWDRCTRWGWGPELPWQSNQLATGTR